MLGRSHELSHVNPPDDSGHLRAICQCGFTTPRFLAAGLAESYLDDHVDREYARAAQVDSAMLHLETMASGTVDPRSRRWLRAVREAIIDRMTHTHPLDRSRSMAVNAVIVDDDPNLRRQLIAHLAKGGTYHVVGEGVSGIDAVALTVVEQPDIAVVDDLMPYMGGIEAIALMRRLKAKAKICLYSEAAADPHRADLVVPKEVPIPALIGQLSRLE